MCKQILKKLTALILSLAMMVEFMPIMAFADVMTDDEPTMLEFVNPEEGDKTISVGTLSTDVDEGGKYILTLVRNSSDGEASVMLKTVDLSAKYGEDYIIKDKNYTTVKEDVEKTILEQSADTEEQQQRLEEAEAFIKEMNDYTESGASVEVEDVEAYTETKDETDEAENDAEETIEENATDEISVETIDENNAEETITEDNNTYENSLDTTTSNKSSLALLKEAQTGRATRAVGETEFQPIESIIVQDAQNDFGSILENSSSTEIVFEDGESIKQIVVEILDDNDSEGIEIADFTISEPSDGWNIGSSVNCTLTINDDEPTVHSLVSFSESEYRAENGTVEITIERSGAEYSLVTAMVRTISSGTAIEGTNYSRVSSIVEFAPYVTEQKINIPVYSEEERDFSLELYDIKGGEEGENIICNVTIIPSDIYAEYSNQLVSAAASDKYEGMNSFKITLDKEYMVYYNDSDNTGEIVDETKTPPVVVGIYYFPYPSSINNGTFSYGHYSGDSKKTSRESKYIKDGEEDMDNPTGAGYLYWYNWVTGRKGKSIFYAASDTFINTTHYQYISADWSQPNSVFGGQKVSMYLSKNDDASNSGTISVKGQFSRGMSKPIVFTNNSIPQAKDINVLFNAEDAEKNQTPKIELYVYGVAAMYRKFNITLEQPSNLTYINGDKKVSAAPAVVEAGEGHSTRYYGQDYQITVKEPKVDSEINGVIDYYEITVGESKDKKVTFKYTPSGNNKTSISFNDDFIKILNGYTKESSADTKGYTTKLNIKPVFKYIDVSVNVIEGEHGYFNSADLKVGKHTFHKGDTLNLAGTSTDSEYDYMGYNMEVYKTASDTQPIIDCDVNKTSDTGDDLKLTLTSERYNLKPNFAQGNYIGIKVTNEAKKYLTILNTASTNKLSSGIIDNMKLKGVDYVLVTDASKNGDAAVTPETGRAYTITAMTNNSNYRPVYKIYTDSEYTVSGECFDYIAMASNKKNIIEVDVEKVNSNEMQVFELTGYTMIPSASVRAVAYTSDSQAAAGITVTAGGTFEKVNKDVSYLQRKSTTSEKDGKFSVKGVKGYSGDVISLKLSNGDVDQVEYVKLETTGLNKIDIQYYQMTEGEDGEVYDTPVVSKGYQINNGNINMPLRSALAPYVSSINYTVDAVPDYVVDVRNNEVPIIASYIDVTADVVRNGRKIKKAVFTKVSKNGATEDFEVESKSDDQSSFTARFKLDTTFESGDLLYISLVDKEDRVFTNSYYDETGTEKIETTVEERKYYPMYTGLSFYVPTIEVVPPTLDAKSELDVEVPLLDNLALSQSSGTLSFTKNYYGEEGEVNRPYTLQFLFTPGVSNITSTTGLTVLDNVKKGTGAAYKELTSTPEAGIEKAYAEWASYFGEDDTHTSMADFEKKYGSLAYKKSLSNISNKTLFDVHAIVLLSFDFLYDYNNNEYVMTSGQYCIGGSFTVAKCKYWTIYGVPVYIKLSGSFVGTLSGIYETNNSDVIDQYTFSSTSNLTKLLNTTDSDEIYGTMGITGTGAVGVGICGVLSARGIIGMNIVGRYYMGDEEVDSKNRPLEGFLFKFSGGLGIDLFLFSLEYTPSLVTYGMGVYEGVSDGVIVLSSGRNGGIINNIDAGTSDMSKLRKTVLNTDNIGQSSTKVYKLLSNARERTKPQIVTLPDGRKFMVFLANNGASNTLNSSALMYSICDTSGEWSEAKAVDDNGTSDVLPELVLYNNKVAVVWSDANKVFSDNEEYKNVLSSLEIAYKVFDSDSNTFGEKTVITNDEYMDTGASFYVDEKTNQICCYYVKRDILTADDEMDLADVASTYSTIACRKYDINSTVWDSEETYLDILHDRIVDPLIIDFNSVKSSIDGKDYVWMTYTVDEDEDLNTVEDREVYLILEDLTDSKTYYPIAVTNNYISDVKPILTNLENETYLSWIDNGKSLKMINLTDVFDQMKEDNLLDTYLSDTNKDWYKKTAGELGLSADEYSNSIYEKLANSELLTIEKDFTVDENIERTVGDYKLYKDDKGNIYVFWTEGGSTSIEDTNSREGIVELYGAVLENSEDDDKYSHWSNAVQITDLNMAIDEFDITFDKNGNMSMVSNLYSQNIDESGNLVLSENSLVEIEFERECMLNVKDKNIEFSKVPAPGDNVNITFDVVNDGLLYADNYDVTVKQVQNRKSEIIYSEKGNEDILSGYTHSYDVEWTVPEDVSNTEIVVEITDNTTGKTTTVKKAVELTDNVVVTDETTKFDSDGKLYLTATITNNGNIESDEIKFNAVSNSNSTGNETVYGTYSAGKLGVGESKTVTFELSGFNPFTELSKYGTADVINNCTVGEENISSNIVRVAALHVVALRVNEGISELNLTPGNTVALTAKTVPENVPDHTVTYSSSNTDVVTVTVDGTVIPVGNGTAEITVSHNDSGIKKVINVVATGFSETSETTTSSSHSSSGGGGGSSKVSVTTTTEATTETVDTEPQSEQTTAQISDWNNPFADVPNDVWFEDSVKYVYENNIFKGITDNTFGPYVDTTRGMLVTVLGRMENIDTELYSDKLSYTDVAETGYYTPYIEWATENNIVAGFGNGVFKPDDNVTREQLVRIIANYIAYKGEDTETEIKQLPFADSDLISQWALDGTLFCYENEIVVGDNNGMFNPKNSATRAELATVIMKIMER